VSLLVYLTRRTTWGITTIKPAGSLFANRRNVQDTATYQKALHTVYWKFEAGIEYCTILKVLLSS
jgi:hypothetical protein